MTQKASPLFSFIGLALVSLLIFTVGCGPDYTLSTSTPASTQRCSSAAASPSNPLARIPVMALSSTMSSQHNGGGNEGFLRAIAAISDTDIWAVGNRGVHPLIEHWNGSSWRIVPGPDLGAENQAVLYAITAVSANDIWAVGRYSIGTTPTFQTLIEHWNASAWSIVPSPNVQGYQQNILQGIAAVSASNIWAVGQGFVNRSQQQFGYCTLIEHWDGTSWKILPHSQLDGGLGGIAASSNTNIWSAGNRAILVPITP